jgi:hypothetical protein
VIYTQRIKGQEYPPLIEGDIVVCITEHFQEFTYGKQYRLYGAATSLLPINSDLGNQPLPAYYAPNGYYFLPLDVWRELKINQICN